MSVVVTVLGSPGDRPGTLAPVPMRIASAWHWQWCCTRILAWVYAWIVRELRSRNRGASGSKNIQNFTSSAGGAPLSVLYTRNCSDSDAAMAPTHPWISAGTKWAVFHRADACGLEDSGFIDIITTKGVVGFIRLSLGVITADDETLQGYDNRFTLQDMSRIGHRKPHTPRCLVASRLLQLYR
jgi:hypothetical protein